ncbi:MAG: segregation/condensation protein A [Clostridia bacterium]|nr:segregation/condensation protein A [Clostridia bacterium]MDD4386283.1 segregation/condensation protein A [Clostridia bacterium]
MKDFLNNNNDYNIVIDNFEGPLDLLLFLISKNKMNIFDISLSDLTDKYIEYLNEISDLNLDITSSFVVMASTLLDIKSKKLLPELEEKTNDELTEEDIISRIIEYKKYKEISGTINQMYQSNFGTFDKPMEKIKFIKLIQYTGENFEINEIYKVYSEVLNRNINKINVNAKEIEKLALYEKITVKDKANQIISYLEKNDCLIFNKLFNIKATNSLEVVTAFLGTLELTKLKQIYVNQKELFSDIYITKNINTTIEYDLSKIAE